MAHVMGGGVGHGHNERRSVERGASVGRRRGQSVIGFIQTNGHAGENTTTTRKRGEFGYKENRVLDIVRRK